MAQRCKLVTYIHTYIHTYTIHTYTHAGGRTELRGIPVLPTGKRRDNDCVVKGVLTRIRLYGNVDTDGDNVAE